VGGGREEGEENATIDIIEPKCDCVKEINGQLEKKICASDRVARLLRVHSVLYNLLSYCITKIYQIDSLGTIERSFKFNVATVTCDTRYTVLYQSNIF